MIKIPKSYSVEFAVDFIPSVMLSLLEEYRNNSTLKNIGSNFGFNAYNALKYIFNHLYIDTRGKNILVSVNKNLHYKGHPLEKVLNIITFGNRTIRGSDAFVKICDYVENNLDGLYVLYASGR